MREEGAKKEAPKDAKPKGKVGRPSKQEKCLQAPSLVDIVLDKIPADGETKHSLSGRIVAWSMSIRSTVSLRTANEMLDDIELIKYDPETDRYFRVQIT